ncbi:FISUMP domain-containing protein [Algoriphagus winogradskyi]
MPHRIVRGNLEGAYTAFFARYSNSEVALMGYFYPGAADFNITPRTTALAMVMMTPAVISLSDDGKKSFMAKALADPAFGLLESEILKNLELKKPLFDETNTGIAAALVQLFSSASARMEAEEKELPVNTFKAGNNFTFNNKGSAVTTVIGIYKGSDRVGKVVVEGLKIVPASIQELISGKGEIVSESGDQQFLVEGEGNFTFKYRTGRPGSSSGAEHDEAFYENLGQFSYNLLQTLIPVLDPKESCKKTVIFNLIGLIHTSTNFNSSTSISEILYTVRNITMSNVEGLIKNCTLDGFLNIEWFEYMVKNWNFIDKAFAVIANGANTTAIGVAWIAAEPEIDVCYLANGNQVELNEKCLVTFTDPRDGNVYKIVKIGDQTWFAENLRYAGNISQVISQQVWAAIWNNNRPTEKPAWSYYGNSATNDPDFGKLYNWFAVNKSKLCPEGWHIPSSSEWKILSDYLGGAAVAGGKMKATTIWKGENVGATNESNFSALPGGDRTVDKGFGNGGYWGSWWSSTSINDLSAIGYYLESSNASLGKDGNIKGDGFSCRCLRD